jgi:type IV secretory pathway VirB2 component (pilin)
MAHAVTTARRIRRGTGLEPIVIALFTIVFYLANAHAVQAQVMATVLCNTLDVVQGDIGEGIATMGVLSVGIAATLGRVSWGMAVTVAIGIAILFSAADVAAAFGITSPCG